MASSSASFMSALRAVARGDRPLHRFAMPEGSEQRMLDPEQIIHELFSRAQTQRNLRPATAETLGSLPVREAAEMSENCPICLETATPDGDTITTMPCGHEMHTSCARDWLAVHGVCPMCRHALTT